MAPSRSSQAYLRWWSDGPDHLLQKFDSHLFPIRLARSQGHVLQQRWVADKACVAVARNIRGPFEFCCIGVAGSDVLVLKRLELLCRTQLVCHCDEVF